MPGLPHVCLITRVITQPNICLSHSPAARPYIYKRWPATCHNPPSSQGWKSPDSKVLRCCSSLWRLNLQTLYSNKSQPLRSYLSDARVLSGSNRISLERRFTTSHPCASVHSLPKPWVREADRCSTHEEAASLSSIKHNIMPAPAALFTSRHIRRPEGHRRGSERGKERAGSLWGYGLGYGDKLSLVGDVVHSPTDIPSGQGEEVEGPVCGFSCTGGDVDVLHAIDLTAEHQH